MTPEQQNQIRIEVAVEDGWTRGPIQNEWFSKQDIHSGNWNHCMCYDLPHYTNSIDAIREAVLRKDEEFQKRFSISLLTRNLHILVHQLTALDWCICYLETAKQMKEAGK